MMPAVPDKAFLTLQAKAALSLVSLHRQEGDHGRIEFVASRWAMTKRFDTLEQVEAWLQQVVQERQPEPHRSALGRSTPEAPT